MYAGLYTAVLLVYRWCQKSVPPHTHFDYTGTEFPPIVRLCTTICRKPTNTTVTWQCQLFHSSETVIGRPIFEYIKKFAAYIFE